MKTYKYLIGEYAQPPCAHLQINVPGVEMLLLSCVTSVAVNLSQVSTPSISALTDAI